MASVPNPLLTPEEYLEMELQTEYKNEYFNGQVFAMAGVSLAHSRISQDINRHLGNQLDGSHCEVHAGELRARTGDSSMYAYPDILIFCGEAKIEKYKGTDTLTNPIVVIEILSPTTETYDRRDKFEKYRAIETLKEYILVSQDRILVERFVRQASGEWLYSSLNRLDDTLILASAPARLTLRDIYKRVFPSEGEVSQ
jgi:Uma2 family endonuclease